jgi:outer membrane protein OmpA-like peptidoglycan-associated protein
MLNSGKGIKKKEVWSEGLIEYPQQASVLPIFHHSLLPFFRYSIISSFLFLIFFLLSGTSNAQDVPFKPESFPGKENELKNAVFNLNEGDKLYFEETPFYQLALPFYEKAYTFNPDNADLNNKLGICYLNSNNKFKAYDFFAKAYKLNPNVDPMIHYNLGRGLHLNSEWDKAIAEYTLYIATTTNDEKIKAAKKRIAECNNGKELVKNPVNVKIENLDASVNSRFAEYTPLISADESLLFFTSRRDDTYGGDVDQTDQVYFEDIYYSVKKGVVWSSPKNLGPPVNTWSHDAAAGLSPDGHTLLVFKGDKNSGDILISKLVKGYFTKPEDAGKNINTKYHESSACLSPDGNTLYFVSDKPGGIGGRDIYKSKWNESKKEWGVAENLGDTINTKYDEEGVFMHPDGRTLYFSSQGHNTMGGYDIFYSSLNANGSWTSPVNIGYPVNTPDDDVFFVVSASGKHGYYASIRKEGLGEKDIYMITFMEEEKVAGKTVSTESKAGIPVSRMAILKGVIRNAGTKEPLAANIELIDLEKGTHIGRFETDSKTGQYLVSLPAGKNYGAIAYSEGFLFESDNFNIPDTAAYSEIVMDIDMKPVEEGNNIILTNIFFETGRFDLKAQSKDILDRVVKLMKDFTTLKVEISGHTDNVGKDDYNQRLSEDRAQSVVDYLIEQKISKDRLTAVGYGKTKPFASNDTAEGRAKNRRIEFKITGK